MQETIRLLASERGLVRIKEIVVRDWKVSEIKGRQLFLTLILPLFQVITDPQVVASIMLEDHLGTICNFLYGRQGERATVLFTFIAQMFVSVIDDEISCSSNLETVLKVLSSVVEWNNHAPSGHRCPPTAEDYTRRSRRNGETSGSHQQMAST